MCKIGWFMKATRRTTPHVDGPTKARGPRVHGGSGVENTAEKREKPSGWAGTAKTTNALHGALAQVTPHVGKEVFATAQAQGVALGDTDRVEIHRAYPLEAKSQVLELLGLTHSKPVHKLVWYFDTHNRDLLKQGAFVRLRHVDGGGGDFTVKLRPDGHHEVSNKIQRAAGFKEETDIGTSRAVHSFSLTRDFDKKQLKGLALGLLASDKQESMLEDFLHREISFDGLEAIGPAQVETWSVQPEGFPYKISVEHWKTASGGSIFEVSVKTTGADTNDAIHALETLISKAGFAPQLTGQTKTEMIFAERA